MAGARASGTRTGWDMAATLDVRLDNDLAEIHRLSEMVEQFGEGNALPDRAVFNLNLCLDELITNIVGYAYGDEGRHSIRVRLTLDSGLLRTEVEDDGRPFNPLDAPPPDLESDLETREIGGLGLHFVKTLMDTVAYERDGAFNRLVMTARVEKVA